MNWFELTLVFIGFMVAAAIINKKTLNTEGVDELIFGGSVQLVTGIICLILALREGFLFNLTLQSGFILLGMLITYLIAVSFFFIGLKHIDLSQETILSASGSVWSLLLGAIILAENITLTKTLGVLLIVMACLILVWEKKLLRLGKYQLLILISAFFYAYGAVLDKQLNTFGNPLSYIAISFSLVGLTMLLLYFKRTFTAIKNTFIKKEFWRGVLINGTLYSLSFWALFTAYQKGGEVSRMFPMTQSISILIPILGMLILKEHKQWLQKTAAIVILFSGLWLLKG